MVSNSSVLFVGRVGQSDEEFTTRESVEALIGVSLDVLLLPNLVSLSGFVDLRDLDVEITGSVHVLPERFSVCWIITTGVVLFATVVNEWNTLGGKRESNS